MGIKRVWTAAALAVIVPAAALCWLQYRSLRELEERTQAAVRDSLRQRLESVRAELETRVHQMAAGVLAPLNSAAGADCDAGPGAAFRVSPDCPGKAVRAAADGLRAAHPTGGFHVYQSAARCASCHQPEWFGESQSALYVYRILPDSSVAAIRIPISHLTARLLPEAVAKVRRAGEPDWTVVAGRQEAGVAMTGGPTFPLLVLSASYQGATIHSLAHAQTRQWALVWAGALGCLLLGASFLLRAAAREARLAELKSAFVSNVSHEMKSPLAMIRVSAETLELGRVQDSARMREYFRRIHRESLRLGDMIDNVLDLARLESGHHEFRPQPVDLAELAAEALDGLDGRVTLHAADPAPLAMADRRAIQGVIWNLLSNARKYSPPASPIEVRVFTRGGHACLAVTDRGIGIAPADQRRIFEKFYRAAAGLAHETKGAGLGLALAAQTVEAHGGNIHVESRLGEGSTFTVTLPIAGVAKAEELAEAAHC
jgi:signal transduction histidine kinase